MFNTNILIKAICLTAALSLTACGSNTNSTSETVEPTAAKATLKISQVPALSVQLWSVKDDVKQDIDAALTRLSSMGFAGVEFANEFGPYGNDPAGLKAKLDELGLKGSGAHVTFEQLNEQNFQSTLAFYQTLGVQNLIIPWDERAWSPEGIDFVTNRLNELDKKLLEHDMHIGFHNHDQEFNDFKGQTYWDYLAQNTTERVILQHDVGWITYAGKDPIWYVNRYPNRTITTHYKVRLPKGTQGKLPIIGQDTIDWENLLKANMSKGGTQWIVVEQEEYPNGLSPMEAVQASLSGLKSYIAKL